MWKEKVKPKSTHILVVEVEISINFHSHSIFLLNHRKNFSLEIEVQESKKINDGCRYLEENQGYENTSLNVYHEYSVLKGQQRKISILTY